MISINLNQIYEKLLNEYSQQGWWPITDFEGTNPTKTGSINGYHVGDYSFPRNDKEQFEIIIGAILTQNTSWPSVEKALINIKKHIEFTPENILTLDENTLKEAIRPAGYFNQKYNYLRNISKFYLSLDGKTPTRDELLNVKGIGNETADSILLFAYKEKEFIVDAYTKRILIHLDLIDEKDSYIKIKKYIENEFKGTVYNYQEFHALFVEHAKHFYSKKPYGVRDLLLNKHLLF
ncbi:MAG: endonuclease III domain-containing protein [archaeon]|nr:endonuclease III domain-containing protein [archaeon]